MIGTVRTMSRRSRRKLMRWTVLGTTGCVAFAMLFNWLLFRGLGGEALARALFSGTIIPMLLAAPLFFYLTLKLRELAIVNHRLSEMASTDGLTGCLNRNAFAGAVEGRIAADGAGGETGGALLVIDADHFKRINDRFGHASGDTALRCIADAIRATVRADDVVGRLGGEEFAVFLPRTSDPAAVAERIRAAVLAISFSPTGDEYPLTISIGGIVFDSARPFSELYREADVRLYEAKKRGRNRVVFAALADGSAPLAKLN